MNPARQGCTRRPHTKAVRDTPHLRVPVLSALHPLRLQLGFWWATKIGGPSHGFDLEGQCLLPLLCNARHKVILVSDPGWPHHPSGRAHFRLLWIHGTSPPRPVLWLETVNGA